MIAVSANDWEQVVPEGWPAEVVGVEQRVPLLDGSQRRYVNLDNAASTPPLVAVRDAVDRFAAWYSSVHRGTGFKSQLSTHAYEAARAAVARFVGAAPDYHTVVLTKSTTEALNTVAHLMQASDALVFTSIMEHHANMLPWRLRTRDLRYVGADAHGVIDLADLERQLRAAPVGRPRLVAISGAYNVTGFTPPIHRVARLVHRYGARLLVDGAQLVPHRPIDLRGADPDERIDFLAFSSHKLYAPYGAGALVAPADAFAAEPHLLGGGIVEMVTLDAIGWTDLPDREEAGSPNVVGALALHAAIERLEQLGMARLAAHEDALTAYALQRLSTVPGLRVLGPPTAANRVGAISFTLADVPPMLVAAILAHEWGIGVRAGCFCAHPGMLHLLGVTPERAAAVRARIEAGDRSDIPGAVRASLALYNSPADVDQLVEALQAVAVGEWRGAYRVDRRSGDYLPQGWHPRFEDYFRLAS